MSLFARQNDREAVKYLKASQYCFRKERTIDSSIMVVSLLLCLTGIFNRYLSEMFSAVENIAAIQQSISEWLVVFSGVFIVVQISANRYVKNLHFTGVNLQESYDCLVYNIPKNKVLMKNIYDSDVEAYARRMRKKDESQFRNYYFASEEAAQAKDAAYENQYSLILTDYKILNFVRTFYYSVWIAFIALIFVIALSFNDNFIKSLTNILIPSLSTISIIMTDQHNYVLSLNKLQNALSVMQAKKQDLGGEGMDTVSVLRGVQDGLFWYRSVSFNVPYFLIRMFLNRDRELREEEEKNFQSAQGSVYPPELAVGTPELAPPKVKKKAEAAVLPEPKKEVKKEKEKEVKGQKKEAAVKTAPQIVKKEEGKKAVSPKKR